MRVLGRTGLLVHPLCLGTNAFGWTADERTSREVLDAYVGAGGNFVDTADYYSRWAPGHEGGESEAIIGAWLEATGRRDEIVLSTKVGALGGLGGRNIRQRVEGCLRRLRVDRIDLLYAHVDDPETPLNETLRAFAALIEEGKVGHIAASNYTTPRLLEALSIARAEGLPEFSVFSGHYNLLERKALLPASRQRPFFEPFEPGLKVVLARERLAFIPYWALAKGFLTGKYLPGGDVRADAFSARSSIHNVGDYMTDRTSKVLIALRELAAAHHVTSAAIALAWTISQDTVASVLGGARTVEQLRELMALTEVELSQREVDYLTALSEDEDQLDDPGEGAVAEQGTVDAREATDGTNDDSGR